MRQWHYKLRKLRKNAIQGISKENNANSLEIKMCGGGDFPPVMTCIVDDSQEEQLPQTDQEGCGDKPSSQYAYE